MLIRLSKNPNFLSFLRLFLLIISLFYIVVTIAFIQRWSITRDAWPWTGTYSSLNELSSIFIASIAAATAGSLLWTVWMGEIAAAAGGGINLAITFGGSGLFFAQNYLSTGNPRLLVAAIISLFLVINSLLILRIGHHIPFKDQRPQPRLVRYSFMVFVALLMIVGVSLVLKIPGVFPWTISVEASVVYGWIFVGAGLYFAYALTRPGWANTGGQLAGFLAYDLVLLYPFLVYLPNVPDRFRFSLILYIVTLLYSTALAIYYLFINPATRTGRPNLSA
ncbi:MAG: hypothetical protein H7X77_08160 [Anaerolineae bacterium]|nr:hypothetical protein [Anaerolineae bacterium]